MNHRKRISTVITAASLGATLFSLAGSVAARPPEMAFPIAIEEARARADARFVEADKDQDGALDREEFAAADWPHRGSRHPGRGHPGHGPHSEPGPDDPQREAHREAMETQLFSTLDDDGDGMLTRAEFSSRKLREAGGALKKDRAFQHLDADGDGKLTREELPDVAERLQMLDADGDGRVTRQEAKAHHAHGRRAGS